MGTTLKDSKLYTDETGKPNNVCDVSINLTFVWPDFCRDRAMMMDMDMASRAEWIRIRERQTRIKATELWKNGDPWEEAITKVSTEVLCHLWEISHKNTRMGPHIHIPGVTDQPTALDGPAGMHQPKRQKLNRQSGQNQYVSQSIGSNYQMMKSTDLKLEFCCMRP